MYIRSTSGGSEKTYVHAIMNCSITRFAAVQMLQSTKLVGKSIILDPQTLP